MATIKGIVRSGGSSSVLPQAYKTVYLRTTSSESSQFGRTTTDAKGEFELNYPFPTVDGTYYVLAEISESSAGQVLLMAVLDSSVPGQVIVNELTTVAAAYSGAQFLSPDPYLTGPSLPMAIVAAMSANIVDFTTGNPSTVKSAMSANIVDFTTGNPSTVLTQSPNAGQTTTLGVTQSLANFLASAVRNPSANLTPLLDLATTPSGVRPANTITALANIARWPWNNVGGIYNQSLLENCYGTPVASQPAAWTIAVKLNDSGDPTRMFAGPANFAFDSRGRAWIPNNVIQGEPDSAPYSMVLDLGGHPAVDDSGQVMTPFEGGGLLGAGFGVAVDPQQRIWVSDFGWTKDTLPVGSVSLFDSNANALSPSPNGFAAGLDRVQGVTIDHAGNVWMASYGNNSVVVYPGAANADTISDTYYAYAPGDPNFQPFGIAIASDGTAWVTNSNKDHSSITHLQFTGSAVVKLSETPKGQVLKGIVIDRKKYIWAASGGDDTVYLFDENGVWQASFQGGGIAGPWGICLDGNDDLWVGNFGALFPGVFEGRLSQLAGTRQSNPGAAITPDSGYTLPTAGEQVLLANNEPLYGEGRPACTIPMMRTTGLAIDAAGNVWTTNNWKPHFLVDTGDPRGTPNHPEPIDGNPGGDGIIIWVGVAKPVTG